MSGRVGRLGSDVPPRHGDSAEVRRGAHKRAAGESYKTDSGPVRPASVQDNRFKTFATP